MGKLFKFIFKLILIVLLLALIPVVATVVLIKDNTNEVDISQYEEGITIDDMISDTLSESLAKMKDTYDIKFTLTEKDANNLIYAFIKKSLNPNYNPISGTTPDELNAYPGLVLPSDLPVVGGKSVALNSIYVKYNGEKITFNACADALGFLKTRLHFTFEIETLENEYVFILDELKLGKINLTGGLAKTALEKINAESEVNSFFDGKDIPFTFSLNDLTLTGDKGDVCDWVASLVGGDKSDDTTKELISLLLSPENDFLNIGMFEEKFGLIVDLAKLRVDPSKTILNPLYKIAFSQDLFIQEKSQSYIINYMSGENAISFNEHEINKLIYKNTNGYESMGADVEFLDGVKISIRVEGITLDVSDDGNKTDVIFIININGLKTIGVISGTSSNVNGGINIKLADDIIIGDGVKVSMNLLSDIIASALETSGFVSFEKETKTIGISKDVVQKMLESAEADGGTPLEVEKIEIVPNGVKASIKYTDPTLETTVKKIAEIAETILSSDFIDTEKFDVTDEEQKQAVETLTSALEDVKEILTNPEKVLESTDTQELVNAIGTLSEENKQEILNQMASKIGEEDLQDLYSQFFGK